MRDTFKKHEAGKKTTGRTALAKLLGEELVKKLAEQLDHRGTEQAELDALNAEHCVVQDGGKTRVLRFDTEKQTSGDGRVVHERWVATFLSFADFANYHCDRTVVTKEDDPKQS